MKKIILSSCFLLVAMLFIQLFATNEPIAKLSQQQLDREIRLRQDSLLSELRNELPKPMAGLGLVNSTTKSARIRAISNGYVSQLDSVITKDINNLPTGKLIYTYNSNGNYNSYVTLGWDSKNKRWRNSFKREYLWDAYGRITQSISFNWDTIASVWLTAYKYVREYHLASDTSSIYNYYEYDTWNSSTKTWDGNYRKEYTYDTRNNQTSYLYNKWNSTNNSWIYSYKYLYTYDNSDRNLLYAYYTWDVTNSVWIGKYKYEYAYDANANLTLDAYYNAWDSNKASWIGSTKYEYAFNNKNKKTLEAYYNSWDATKSSWIGSYKDEYSFDTQGRQTLEVHYPSWNSTTSSWVGSFKVEDAYDTNGYIVLDAVYSWDTTTNNWTGDSKYTYTYDSNGLSLTDNSYIWVSSVNSWFLYTISTYYYSTVYSGVTPVIQQKVAVYPNPAKTVINLKGISSDGSVTITDLNGKTVGTWKNIAGSIDISTLNNGSYLLNLSNGGQQSSTKFIKQ